MTKLKFASAALVAAIALSGTVASAHDSKRSFPRANKSIKMLSDRSSATAAQLSGATLQGGAGDSGGGAGFGGG